MIPKTSRSWVSKALRGGSLNQTWIFLGLGQWFSTEGDFCL